jgi:hypothetical protein
LGIIQHKNNKILSTFQKLKDLVAATEADAKAFHNKGNKAAGTRLRKLNRK